MSLFPVSNSVMRARPLLLALAIVGADASSVLLSQERSLSVQSATPSGELTNAADANEIRRRLGLVAAWWLRVRRET